MTSFKEIKIIFRGDMNNILPFTRIFFIISFESLEDILLYLNKISYKTLTHIIYM